jgi:hypothetical protein
MFKFIKVAALSVAMAFGVANVSHADARKDLCIASGETVVAITTLFDNGYTVAHIAEVMIDNGVPKSYAEEMVVFTFIGYVLDGRPAGDVAFDYYLRCMGEDA